MDKMELRFAGSGGQGVILGSIIIAEAALNGGYHVAQSQSYGPEARGGMCKAEVIVDREQVDFQKVVKADFLLALTQKSLDEYAKDMAEGGRILADARLDISGVPQAYEVVTAPILDTAMKELKAPVTVNMVAIAAVNAYLRLTSSENLEETALRHVPRGTEALNLRALRAGESLRFTARAAPA